MERALCVPSRRRAGMVGAVAAGVAVACGEFVTALLDSEPSPVLAVGGRFVDRFAASLKDLAVAIFGTNDKAALVVGTVVLVLALGAVTGVAARGHGWITPVVFTGFGAFGLWAQSRDPQVEVPAAASWHSHRSPRESARLRSCSASRFRGRSNRLSRPTDSRILV
ncbi:MAG: hypothetical protein R2698_12245 [Microthrixaceae bacterium]